MIKELKRSEFPRINVIPGDSLVLQYTEGDTTIELCRYDIQEETYFDVGIMFYIDGEDADRLSIEAGYGGIFGRKKIDDNRNALVRWVKGRVVGKGGQS